MKIVTVSDLTIQRSKRFKLHIKGISLHAGKTLCITGPNGSGKTTFIECLAGLLKPSNGTINVNGSRIDSNLRAIKSLIGFIPDDESWLIKELCAREYFELLSSIYRKAGITCDTRSNAERLAKALHFTNHQQQLGGLSHGNKKKVQIIAGLMHAPAVIIVDELRNGLDPLAIIAAEAVIKEQSHRGACVIVATHDLWWAERISDETMLLVDGSVVVYKKTTALVKEYGSLEQLFIRAVSPTQAQYAAL